MKKTETILSRVRVGSRVTVHPPPTDTDEDWLILTDSLRELGRELGEQGYSPASEYFDATGASRFVNWRRGREHLIVTANEDFYRLFLVATGLAKRFNLTAKGDRVALFQAVLYGKAVES
jgi:hypothetical protein